MFTKLPEEITGLPVPWCIPGRARFLQAMEAVPRTEERELEAVDVIGRILSALDKLGRHHRLPDSDEASWPMLCYDVKQNLERIDDYRRELFEELHLSVTQRRGTRETIDMLAAGWLVGAVDDLFRHTVDWLLGSLRRESESAVAEAYRKLVRDRWKHIDEIKASSLVSYLALMRCPETEELLREIDNDPEVTSDLKHAVMGVYGEWNAQDYYKANPHLLKW